jgi:glyceraldehyde 3-phosphate dehydrogenase
VLQSHFGIEHGSITTIHNITNTQSILDEYHDDLRRARASSLSLIPTSTGSATAITEIFPQLKGRINGIAVRVPLANASLTDCVFELQKSVTAEAVNAALKAASEGHLNGILGYEDLPLVSADYTNDTRSGIVDGLSTMVVNNTQVKVLIWYDNETGYVNRMMELVAKVAASL